MSRWASCIAVGVLLAPLLTGSADGAVRPTVQLLAGNTREVYVDRNRVDVGFPVQLPPGVRATELSATVVSVTFGKRSELRLKSAFTARVQPPVRAGAALLVTTVDLDPPLEPGTYRMVVATAGRMGTPPRRRATRVSLAIVVPAAKLRVPKPLVIERTLPALGIGKPSDELPPLILLETSGRSRLTRVEIVQDGAAKEGSKATVSTVDFTPPGTVDPGHRASATYVLTGTAFDRVGTVSGSVDIDSPELAAPVSFDYEVHVRRSTSLILILAVLGVVLGFLVRVVLQRLIDVSRARQAAADLALTLENAASDGDDTLRQMLEPATAALEPAFDWWTSPTDVENAVNAAGAVYRPAAADFATRTREAVDAQATLAAIANTAWALPYDLDAAFAAARDSLLDAKQQLDQRQADRAREEQLAAETALQSEVTEKAREWSSEAVRLLNATESSPPPPASISTALAELVQRARAALAAQPMRPDAKLAEVLPALDTAFRAVGAVPPVLAESDSEVNAVAQRVPEAAAELKEALRSFDAIAGDRTAGPAQVEDGYKTLIETLARVVRDHSGDPEMISQGRYADALPARDTALSGLALPSAAAPASTLHLALDTGRPVSPVTPALGAVIQALPPARILRRRVATTLFAAWLLQWLILSVIFVGLAYVLFADGWEGTWQEAAEVFLWAFALDVSTNTLLEQAKGISKGPAEAASGA